MKTNPTPATLTTAQVDGLYRASAGSSLGRYAMPVATYTSLRKLGLVAGNTDRSSRNGRRLVVLTDKGRDVFAKVDQLRCAAANASTAELLALMANPQV